MSDVSPEDLGEEQVVALLAKSRDVDLRTELVWRLSALSADSATAYSALLHAAERDPNAEVRAQALECLQQSSDYTDETIATLLRILESDRSSDVRWAALQVLGNDTPVVRANPKVLPALFALWAKSRGVVRDEADTTIRILTGRYATEWTLDERKQLTTGSTAGEVAKSSDGCASLLIVVIAGAIVVGLVALAV